MLPLYREKRTGEDKREAVWGFFSEGRGEKQCSGGGGGYNDETRESQTETVKERQRKGGGVLIEN